MAQRKKRGEEELLEAIAGAADRPLIIGGAAIPCFVLEDGTRVLVQRGMATAMGMSTLVNTKRCPDPPFCRLGDS